MNVVCVKLVSVTHFILIAIVATAFTALSVKKLGKQYMIFPFAQGIKKGQWNMSVLIKGMEMPNKGEYEMTLFVLEDGTAYFYPHENLFKEDTYEAIRLPTSHKFVRCVCEDSNQDKKINGVKLISGWAAEGIELAGEYGKTLDDLIVFLKSAYGMKMLFDAIGKTDKERK